MNDTFELVDTIADQLGETEPMPVQQIRRVVQVLGPARALMFLEQTLEIEAAGGMLVPDGSRRRRRARRAPRSTSAGQHSSSSGSSSAICSWLSSRRWHGMRIG
jgi:hypothetical protein